MLTNLFDEVSERGFRVTPRGMAYWSGSGPALKKCRDCVFFSGKARKKGTCGKFAKMMQNNGPKFGGYVPACKYFEIR
jgi:hypothetical protein